MQNKFYIDITCKAARRGRSHCSKTAKKKKKKKCPLFWWMELLFHNNHRYVWREKGEAHRLKKTNHGARWWQHHRIDGVTRNVDISKQHLTKSRYLSGHHKAPASGQQKMCVGRTEKEANKQGYDPDSVTAVLSGGKACGRLPAKHLTQVKQQCSQILSACKPLTHLNVMKEGQ